MWQISGPSATGNYILVYLHEINFHFKSKFKETRIYEKEIPTHHLGPHTVGRLEKQGVCQLAKNEAIGGKKSAICMQFTASSS